MPSSDAVKRLRQQSYIACVLQALQLRVFEARVNAGRLTAARWIGLYPNRYLTWLRRASIVEYNKIVTCARDDYAESKALLDGARKQGTRLRETFKFRTVHHDHP